MPAITATFETRREAELAIEHLVQEHDIDRGAIVIGTEDDENSAGEIPNGADDSDGQDDSDGEGAALNGGIVVTATVETDEDAEAVSDVFHEFGGSDVSQDD